MVHYFYGRDTYRAREAIGELAEKQRARIRWVDRQDLETTSPGEMLSRGGAGLFGAELAVVRGVEELPTGLQKDLLAAVAAAGKSVSCVVWDRGKPDKRSAVYRGLRKQATEFGELSRPEIMSWLVARAQHHGGTIDQPAAQMMIDRLGYDRWRLSSELDRLLLINETISEDAVNQSVAETATAQIFAMLDALARGQRERVIDDVNSLLAAGESEFYILAMLAYQFRTLLVVRRGIDCGQSQAEIAKEAKIKPYSVQKSYTPAQRFSESFLRDALTRILATDFAIRQGRMDQRTGLLMLVLSLMR
jgi:DNA polymerase III delta subunit